ncbi:MAG: hypothetical protein M9963_04875 [Kiritimatiellae bacterium]|nr:hypothetical protein [Kiritimatiellia bacterium]MCO5061322.1 hypothetical protein [Kiritimatiellia bacterium]MCO5067601.1 hypothetical protein [Kiritimatiellia bacterium]MCO6400168.1 hypothetical protein [Verrucomicrobiota bacterium]
MIVPSQGELKWSHAIEPLVQSAIGAHPASKDALRAAWDSVLHFFEERDRGILREPEAALLLYARALAACNQSEVAREVAHMAPCAVPLARHVSVERLSLNAIQALASGSLRPVQESSLSQGLVLVVDGSRFQRDENYAMAIALLPVLRSLVRTALELMAMTDRRGLLLFRGWSAGETESARAERRAFVDAVVDREAVDFLRPEVMWVD